MRLKHLLGALARQSGGGGGGGGGGSGNDSFTVVLLHFDGTNGSTTITDSNAGGTPKTWSCVGAAALDTSEKMFGTASLKIISGTDAASNASPDSDFAMGTGDFTIDCWYKRSTTNEGGAHALFGWGGEIEMFSALGATNFKHMEATFWLGGGNYADWESALLADDTSWHHYAVVRSGTSFMMFIDGINTGTNQTSALSLQTSALAFTVGNFFGSEPIVGWIDEFRISKGIARWTSNFTPPTSPYGP